MYRGPTRPVASLALLGALALVLVGAFVPLSPRFITDGLDPSWVSALAVSLLEQRAFGREVIFTFGPLGFLATESYWPRLYPLTLAFWVAAVVSMVVALVEARQVVGGIAILASALMLAMFGSQRDAFVLSLCFVTILATCYGRPNPVGWIYMVAVLGVIATSKFTFFLVSTLAVCTISVGIARHYRSGLIVVPIVFVLSFSAAWVFAGQTITALPTFLKNSFQIASGYNEAMGVSGPAVQVVVLVSQLLLLFGLALSTSYASGQGRLVAMLPVLSMFAIGFVALKQGVVRHDGHVLATLAFLWFIGPLIFGWWKRLRSPTLRAFASLTFAAIAIQTFLHTSIVTYSTGLGIRSFTGNAVRSWIANVRRVENLFDEKARVEAHLQSMAAIADRYSLPVLEGSVDTVPYNINRVLASGLDWNARPIFQSYSAYTPPLSELNRAHFASANGPRHVFVDVSPIDNRLATLEDPLVWIELISRFRFDQLKGSTVVVTREPLSRELTRRQVPAKIDGNRVELPALGPGEILLAKLQTPTSLSEQIRALLYKPEELFLEFRFERGEAQRYRYIRGAGPASFVISPLVASPSDLIETLCALEAPSQRRIAKSVALVDSDQRALPLTDAVATLELVKIGPDERCRSMNIYQELSFVRSIQFLSGIEDVKNAPIFLENGHFARNAHAPAKLRTELPPGENQICFGVRGGASNQTGFDGVTFEVHAVIGDAERSLLLQRRLGPTTAPGQTVEECHRISISKTTTTIELVTVPGASAAWDWSYWRR